MTTRFLLQTSSVEEKTRLYILKRVARVEKLIDPASKIEIELDKDKKGKFRVEMMVRTPRHLYRAEETSESIEGSLDLVIDKLENEITRDKDKRVSLKRRGARSIKKKLTLDKSARF